MHDVDLVFPPEFVEKYYGSGSGSGSGAGSRKREIIHYGKTIKGYYDYPDFLGGAIEFSRNAFERINGFPNHIYGWGGEDDALAFRIHISDIVPVHRPVKSEGTPGYELETTNDVKKLRVPALHYFHLPRD
jgi:hypothetical protein